MINLLSRLVGAHRLQLPNFFPYLQRYLQPHQRDITLLLAYLVQEETSPLLPSPHDLPRPRHPSSRHPSQPPPTLGVVADMPSTAQHCPAHTRRCSNAAPARECGTDEPSLAGAAQHTLSATAPKPAAPSAAAVAATALSSRVRAQACHELLTAEMLSPLLLHLANHFVTDKSRPEMVAIGLNTTREAREGETLRDPIRDLPRSAEILRGVIQRGLVP